MWGRKKENAQNTAILVKQGQHEQARAEAVIALVDSQEEEVKQITYRLESRERKNNFGDALELAMQRRNN